MPSWWAVALLLCGVGAPPALGSMGDRSQWYIACERLCSAQVCADEENAALFDRDRPVLDRLVGWGCDQQCAYHCMWSTVSQFAAHNLSVPQFHGKWPFVRLLSMQEPASVAFSLMNLCASAHMLRRLLRHPLGPTTHMGRVWIGYGAFSCFAWLCAAVFHWRDTAATEMLDYTCAAALVMYKLYAAGARIYEGWAESRPSALSPYARVGAHLLRGALLGFFAWHVHYMNAVKFDYAYNMAVAVGCAAVGALLWIAFVLYQSLVNGRWRRVWPCALAVCSAVALLSLELLDFPPIWWAFDAHSLWHLGTAPLPLLWLRFVADDLRYLYTEKDEAPGAKQTRVSQKEVNGCCADKKVQ